MYNRKSATTLRVAVSAFAIFALAGCGSAVTNDEGATETQASTSSGAEGNQTSYPLSVESCGVTQIFEEAPSRAVTLTSTATETMLELGLEEHMVGTSYLRGREIGPQYEEAFSGIPILAEGQPSMEQLLSVDPDFAYAGYPDGFSESSGHTRDQLAEFDILTHLSPVGCTDVPKQLSDMPEELRTIGQIFNVNDEAEAAVARFEEIIAGVQDTVEGAEEPTVFLYNSGEDAPMTVGGWAYASVMIEAAGGRNIFADEDLRWGQVSWEQVAAADPDIILIYDYLEPSSEEKIETLKGIPAIADTKAIQNDNFAEISLSLAQPGPRSADGVEVLAEQFHPDLFAEN